MDVKLAQRLEKYQSRWIIASGIDHVFEKYGYSVFSRILVDELENNSEENFSISELFQRVQTKVSENVNQIPVSGRLAGVGDKGGEFIFKIKNSQEEKEWRTAVNLNDAENYKLFLNNYPNSLYENQAEEKIEKYREKNTWRLCLSKLDVLIFRRYISEFPNGDFISEARGFIKILSNKKIEESNFLLEEFCYNLCSRIDDFKRFKIHFPDSFLVEKVNYEIKRLSEQVNIETIFYCKEKYAKGEIDEIFEALLSKRMEESFYKDLLHISHRWNVLNRNNDKGILGYNEFNLENNQISQALLNLISSVERELLS